MNQQIETLVDAYTNGRLSRRQLLAGLGTMFATAALDGGRAAAAPPASTFRTQGLNHIALRVTQVDHSRDFYMKHLGATVLRQGSRNCFLRVGGNNFVALFQSDSPGMDHYCYTIAEYDPASCFRTLEAEGLNPRRAEDRVYFDDPDGLEVQIASEWGDYPGPRP
ncbi:MAG: VOC family protein [Acidobacteria bacterium]|nr:VOC family protein [Acidobacteriota bacterium]